MEMFLRWCRGIVAEMNNKAVLLVVMVLVVSSLLGWAEKQPGQNEASQGLEEQDCGFWCKVWAGVGNLFSGDRQEAMVG